MRGSAVTEDGVQWITWTGLPEQRRRQSLRLEVGLYEINRVKKARHPRPDPAGGGSAMEKGAARARSFAQLQEL